MILSVENLSIQDERSHLLVRNVGFHLKAGRCLGLIGASGSGKSTTAACILGLLAQNLEIQTGAVFFENTDLLKATEPEMLRIRGRRIGYGGQPLSACAARMNAGAIGSWPRHVIHLDTRD